jgi:predicted metal-binding protein
MKKKTLSYLCKRAVELGAKKAKIIAASSVKTAPWVRYKCQFGCDGYGGCLTCPPNSPTPEQAQKIIDSYSKAILIHTPSGWKADISGIVSKLEREAFLAGYYKAFGMGAGPCRLCRICDWKNGCRHADKARPAMEACGIDVFQTARNNGFTINTVNSFQCKASYFGLVLIV